MQQRMQPPGDNSNGVHTARELKTVWLLGQVNCDISPLLPNSCRRACGCRSCIWFSHCVDQIASFPHLTCDRRPTPGTTLLYYTGSTCVILIPILASELPVIVRPQAKLSRAPCGLHGVRKGGCGATVLFLPVNYVPSWPANLGGPFLTSLTSTCCECVLSCYQGQG